MKTLFEAIVFEETSYHVALLHKALGALGLVVAKEEVLEQRAGADTRSKVRALQAQYAVPVDENVLVDPATTSAMYEALGKKGMTAASRSFTVTGTVRLEDGSVKARQRLLALDMDLRGVAVYRTVKTLDEIRKQGGSEFLGATVSDSRGAYSVTFYDWQYRRADRNKADVVVFAIEPTPGGEGMRIVGRSRLVSAGDYSDQGLVQGLGVTVVETDKRTEYDAVMSALKPFLDESEVRLRELAASMEQRAFTASELEIDPARIDAAAAAELLRTVRQGKLSHELLYGLGRQGVSLDWAVLCTRRADELHVAIAAAVEQRIIRTFKEREIAAFLAELRGAAAQQVVDDGKDNPNGTNAMLANALPEAAQRAAFVRAVGAFAGTDFAAFWNEHLPSQPEFKDKPEFVASLLLTQQLTAATGNHQALVRELQVTRGIKAASDLLDLDQAQWLQIIAKTGVPAFVKAATEDARARDYADLLQSTLNAAFPTQRIARMAAQQQLPVGDGRVVRGVGDFLAKTPRFDFVTSRVHDFDREIAAVAGDDHAAVRSALLTTQRVFQVSTSPEAMTGLMAQGLHSAYSIAGIPRRTFLESYGGLLGGERAAFAIHQRAGHIAARSELAATHVLEYAMGQIPSAIMGDAEMRRVKEVLENQVPNYAQLFGSPDICECEHCRSVYGAAAYFVDLLRFLWRGQKNQNGKSPLDMLAARRPDLLYLPLTCENTNTIIPYIDLANEIMEYYAANDSLAAFQGYDTGEATAEELRANPQNFNLEAYRKLKVAKYPFSLPYHQPLDVIRTYSDHLKVSRYEAMKAMNASPSATTARAIAAESIRMSEEEHVAIAGTAFDGTADATPLHAYFGYTAAPQLDGASAVLELLQRAGIKYTELVELVKTVFLNPHQAALDFIQELVSHATISGDDLYKRLEKIEAGTLDPATDADLTAALTAYNADHGTMLTPADFGTWVVAHLGELRAVITLFEPQSRCDLATTTLRTIEKIYSGGAGSGITNAVWSKLHRFVRLWRKLGWTIHETDLMLAALGDDDITDATIAELESVTRLAAATKLPVNQLATLWGSIDAYGDKSLYKKLFLNKSVQRIDTAFQPDGWGSYLQDGTQILEDHKSAILAAFRMREDDLAAILVVARVIDGGIPRPIDPKTDVLNLGNLTTIYRHVALAKALKLRVVDLCKLVDLFDGAPFTRWDVQQQKFVGVVPSQTYDFCQLVASVKTANFKPAMLEYIFRGTLPAESMLGLDREKVRGAAKAIRDAFSTIEQDHPETPPAPLTAEALAAKLALTFQPDVVGRVLAILDGTASFEALADANLAVVIPDPLVARYTYVKGSGRLIAAGVMTDGERAALKALAGINGSFTTAVDNLYAAPEEFLAASVGGVLPNAAERNAELLDHPMQVPTTTIEEKLAYVYVRFVPILKSKLRRDAITQHVAALVRLSAEATALLLAPDIGALVTDLSTDGFSATYFSDATWTTEVVQATDATVDFDWGTAAPRPLVPADNFSVRWEAYVAAPASGEYTFVVSVAEADEALRLYLDNVLILEKVGGNVVTSVEVVTQLNAARMYLLRLEYAETTQNAAIHLQWKTAATALDVVPASVAYPTRIVDAFVTLAGRHHRAAKFIAGLGLSETELDHFLSYPADFGNIDFKAVDAGAWRRVRAYAALRDAVPQAQAPLTDVFVAAKTQNPAPTVAALKALLHQATAWDDASIDFLVDSHFMLAVADFANEIALGRLRDVMEIIARTGLSAQTVAEWGGVKTDFDKLDGSAQVIKNAVKAKYEEADWLSVAGELSDKIRRHQQQALIAYLLTRPSIQAWGARDADALFEHFLIDVQMGACMDTSRIVQANSSIQMFVNRCLLNLESERSSGQERGISPGAIDKDRWEWMKAYRVWEANRKVFLYPENWLEPEWRIDRSEFFKDLEAYLVQNDITDRSVEQAFRNYLASLNAVANLDVCGVHREDYDDGKLKYLHVVGRTHNGPYKYYYRRWNEYQKWSTWVQVPVDIRTVETAGHENDEASGVQLCPVVWKKRLFLFWPEFIWVERPPSKSGKSIKETSDDKVSTLESTKLLELRIAWSEYVDGKWTPKQVSKEHLTEWPQDAAHSTIEKDYLITASIDADTQELELHLTDVFWNLSRGSFFLADIQSPVRTEHYGDARWVKTFDYRYQFSKRRAWKELELVGKTYLRTSVNHTLLPVDTFEGLDLTLDNPFFFGDRQRMYFVRPVQVFILDWVRNPSVFRPYVPGLVDDSKYRVPPNFPHRPRPIGPDDYMPGPDFHMVVNPAVGLRTAGVGSRAATGAGVGVRAAAGATGMARAVSPAFGATAPAEARALALQSARLPKPASLASEIGKAFYGHERAMYDYSVFKLGHYETGLEFHTFHHPYSSEYVRRLNQTALPGLLESDTVLPSDEGKTFVDEYDPDFTPGYVAKPSDFATRTYYKENVCFDVYGANAAYNWELFFHAPLYIATRLSRNGRYEEAMKWFHYIFDPTTDELPAVGQTEVSRYWKVLPFKTTPATSLEDWFRSLAPNSNPNTENAIIGEWRDNPFDPHKVAANRPIAYMKHVVMKYVENLIAWGDFLFRQDTMESVNEALQIYVIANHILGKRPEFVPKRGEIKAESYDSLKNKWDDFSNALVELENIFPYSSDASVSSASSGTSLLGVGSALYFCIPANDKLLEHWDTVADRLYKIRHCMNLDGVERRLALFAPPIDPAALIAALSQGLSLGSILADLSSPPPIYRFTFLVQKANELCADVKALGTALLGALEKKDAEELGRLRATNETQMLELTTAVRERQVLAAKATRESLDKARETAAQKLQHYVDLLGNDSVTVPSAPEVSVTLTADSQLPPDTTITTVEPDVDVSLVDGGESGVKVIPKEKENLDRSEAAKWTNLGAATADTLAGIFSLFPQFDGEGTPFGVGAGAWWGGQNLGAATSAAAKAVAGAASFLSAQAGQAATMATFIRREQEWAFQGNLAAREIVQLDKQITSAEIQFQIAQKELENHKQSIENAKAVEQFLKDKFTGQELYQWMKEQLFAVYKQSYNLAYDLAKKAEKAYKYELGTETASFISYGYWDDSKQGLSSGEKLQLALRQLEKSYLEENRRELELSKNISLARLDPLALITLRETGTCRVTLPEELFDLDFRGHYFRRIKSVRLSIPCVVGPHTSIACSLRLLSNTVRANTAMNESGNYEHENDEGVWIDDDRFRTSRAPVTAIATSQAQADSGMFELSFRDERYLPFERAGAISEWRIELSAEKELRQFDYTTISDVIIHLNYTAREDNGLFKAKATTYLTDFLANAADLTDQPLVQMFSMTQEFPSEWYRFLHPAVAGADQILGFTLGKERFPFFVQGRTLVVEQIELFARCGKAVSYDALLSYTDHGGNPVASTKLTLPQVAKYGNLNHVTIGVNDAGVDQEELDVAGPMTIKLKESAVNDYKSLATNPEDEVTDLYVVFSYKLQ
jgi:hypothetical protein